MLSDRTSFSAESKPIMAARTHPDPQLFHMNTSYNDRWQMSFDEMSSILRPCMYILCKMTFSIVNVW
jgi:hypothetical protein